MCVTGEEKLDLMACDDLNFLKREGIGGEKRTANVIYLMKFYLLGDVRK